MYKAAFDDCVSELGRVGLWLARDASGSGLLLCITTQNTCHRTDHAVAQNVPLHHAARAQVNRGGHDGP